MTVLFHLFQRIHWDLINLIFNNSNYYNSNCLKTWVKNKSIKKDVSLGITRK